LYRAHCADNGMVQDLEEPLHVNDGPLQPSEIARLTPSDPTLPLEELRSRLSEDGYLFLKGLLPRQDVLKAREKYFNFLAPSGILKDGTLRVSGIFDAAKDVAQFPGIGVGRVDMAVTPEQKSRDFVTLALNAHGQEWYSQDFCRHPVLLDFMARFTGWGPNTRPLERTLLRNNIPNTKAIGVHYDQIFLRYGEPTSITVWVPMGDISLQGGGLIYLERGMDHRAYKRQ
jgi:phytanoyl-CoA hydroxylase